MKKLAHVFWEPYTQFRRKPSLKLLFDNKWYASSYKSILGGLDPFRHYMAKGFREGCEPNPFFDSPWYAKSAGDAGYLVRNPLSHYVAIGAHVGLVPSPYFDPQWYLDRYRDVAASKHDPFLHFVLHGADEKRDPNPFFDSRWYADHVALPPNDSYRLDVPLLHYIHIGEGQGLRPSPAFDPQWYVSAYDDVHAAGARPLHHFLHHGRREGRQASQRYLESELFNPEWYMATNKDVDFTAIKPFDHYMSVGYREGREPSPLFDSQWYREQADRAHIHVDNPLTHYVYKGASAGLNPSPYFDGNWYALDLDLFETHGNPFLHFLKFGMYRRKSPNQYLDADWYSKEYNLPPEEPALIHYLAHGEARGYKPSEAFDPEWYRKVNPDVRASGMGPLRHFLCYGRSEGRDGSPQSAKASDVENSSLICIKEATPSKETMLLVSHSPDGKLKIHAEHYIKSAKRLNISVILIVASDTGSIAISDDILAMLDGCFVRENAGFDFAAWAHVIRVLPTLRDCKLLIWSNDSIVGPLSDKLFDDVLNRIRSSACDVVGLTDNYEINWHLQSYFVAFKSKVLKSEAFDKFVCGIKNLETKRRVITAYEITYATYLCDNGFKCEALFPAPQDIEQNQTIYGWRDLLDRGFPFVKVSTLRDPFPGVFIEDWREVLGAHGFDISLIDPLLTSEPALVAETPVLPVDDFDRELYLSVHSDVAQAGAEPYEHYQNFGRREGRIASVLGLANFRKDVKRKGLDSVLVVSHEAVRGGAPILAYNIAAELKKKYNVVMLFLAGGPLVQSAMDIDCEVIGPISLGSPRLADYLIDKIASLRNIKFAVANTVESRYVLKSLALNDIPSISLIHEFASYVSPKTAIPYVTKWSGKTVFSTRITADNAYLIHPELKNLKFPIIPQGLTNPPPAQEKVSNGEKQNVAEILKPKDVADDTIVVLGAGVVEYRKGVDLFVQFAAKLRDLRPDVSFRFVWMGRGFNAKGDLYSAILSDQIQRSNLEGSIHFIGEINDVEAAYRAADLFVLSSRLDPLPNVTVEALWHGLPVLCFDKTTGISELLENAGLGEFCVADYLDAEDLARLASSLVHDKLLLGKVAERSKKLAREMFEFPRYVEKLEALAETVAAEHQVERSEIETIHKSGMLNPGYHGAGHVESDDDLVIIAEHYRESVRGIAKRKLFPGFHPLVFAERNGLDLASCATSEYIKDGMPNGPWKSELLMPTSPYIKSSNGKAVSSALHIHCYYTDLLSDILTRIAHNSCRPDLFISVKSDEDAAVVSKAVKSALNVNACIEVVANRGRDLAPFFVHFGASAFSKYEVIGHVHTKNSSDVGERSAIDIWRSFLMENVLGGAHSMIDITMNLFGARPDIGIVIPDDPHIIGWDGNRKFADVMWRQISSEPLPEHFWFPVGSMCWARYEALKPLFDLGLDLTDFPAEPLPYDGSMVHALERLMVLSSTHAGFSVATSYCPGINR